MDPIDYVVADWCKLDIELFRRLYERCTAGADAVTWSLVVAQAPVGSGTTEALQGLRRVACREALRIKVLGELALSISKVQSGLGLSEAADADALMARVIGANVGGRMQALVGAGGLLARETLLGTLAVDSATAIVYRGTQVVGTAFLAGPDVVMTAAHVVMKNDGADFLAELEAGLSFSFRVYEGGASKEPVIAYPATTKPLLNYSLPWGTPPNLLRIAPPEESAKRLDFAIIKLDREVRHVNPLNVASPPKPYKHDALVVLGFPGGTAMKWHVGSVASVEAARLQHRANALPGMSGSCCINVDGNPVALHEGSLATNTFAIGGGVQDQTAVNRAVCLWVIRNAMPAGSDDPLRKRPGSAALEFHDEWMVRRWAKTGLRFASPGLQGKWRELVTAAVGAQPEAAGTVAAFHPWFARDTFEAWVDQNAALGRSANRLCIVSGNPGTGKSFLASILRRRVRDEVNDAVIISATETTAWSWREAIQKWGVKLESVVRLRPEAGVAIHDEAPKAAEVIAAYGSRGHASDQPLFVLIDFDGNASFQPDEQPPWLPFMSELLGHSWVCLVVVGAPEFVTSGLADLMQDRDLGIPLRIRLEHVGRDEFRTFARRLLRKGRPSVPPAEVDAAMKSLERILDVLPATSMQTVAAVLAGILLRQNVGG